MKILMLSIFSVIILFIVFRYNNLSSQEFRSIADKCASDGDNLMRKQGFTLSHFGDGNRCIIRSIICGYNTTQYQFTEIEDARSLIVEKVLQFIEPFNKEKRIRMYLQNFPYDSRNIIISLYFVDQNNKSLPLPYICAVSNLAGVVEYRINSPESTRPKLLYKETFEDALKLYQEKKSIIKNRDSNS